MILAERKESNPAIAAAIILIGFGVLAYFVPSIMLVLGKHSQIAGSSSRLFLCWASLPFSGCARRGRIKTEM